MARKLQTTLHLAGVKAEHGWQNLSVHEIESRNAGGQRTKLMHELLSHRSDSSSSDSEFSYPMSILSSSPMKRDDQPFHSDSYTINSSNGMSGHRKRHFDSTFQHPSASQQRKRYRSSPTPVRKSARTSQKNNNAWKNQFSLAQSSPIKPRRTHFTTSEGPNVSFANNLTSYNIPSFTGSSSFMSSTSEEEHNMSQDLNMSQDHAYTPPHFRGAYDIRSSPPPFSSIPQTPPSHREFRKSGGHKNGWSKDVQDRDHGHGDMDISMNGRLGENGADLLLYLHASPSQTQNSGRMPPPTTPPSRNMALPSSHMTTPGGSYPYSAGFGNPSTPNNPHFDFADFVNITPSPAARVHASGGGSARTPGTARNRVLMFDRSPLLGHGSESRGLGMKFGDEIL